MEKKSPGLSGNRLLASSEEDQNDLQRDMKLLKGAER